MKKLLILLLLPLFLFGCECNTCDGIAAKPKFKTGQIVNIKLNSTKGMIMSSECRPECEYRVRVAEEMDIAYFKEFELTSYVEAE